MEEQHNSTLTCPGTSSLYLVNTAKDQRISSSSKCVSVHGCAHVIPLMAPALFVHSVKEACIILRLSVGSAILLRNVLEEAEEETNAGDHERPTLTSTLHELGVYCLAPCDVLNVLGLRVSWPGSQS